MSGEFHVRPVFNQLIEEGGIVRTLEIDRSQMYGIGTPEDLEAFGADDSGDAAVAAAS